MTTVLSKQTQLENKFLKTINTQSFEQLCYSHIEFFKTHLHLKTSYAKFAQRTQRGTLPLQYTQDLITYITLYGLAHYQRMQALLEHTQLFSGYSVHTPLKFAIIDYGCGQGIATLALIDHLVLSPYTVEALDILLIEPSEIALDRAEQWINIWAEKHPHIEITLTIRQHYINELDVDYLKFNTNEYVYIHLFSNILDLHYSGSFDICSLCAKINQQQGKHLFLAISPDYFAADIGFDLFHQQLNPVKTHINLVGDVLVKEFNYKLFDFYQRKAPVRAYAAYQYIVK